MQEQIEDDRGLAVTGPARHNRQLTREEATRLRQEEKKLITEKNNLQQQLDDQIRKLAIEHTLR